MKRRNACTLEPGKEIMQWGKRRWTRRKEHKKKVMKIKRDEQTEVGENKKRKTEQYKEKKAEEKGNEAIQVKNNISITKGTWFKVNPIRSNQIY